MVLEGVSTWTTCYSQIAEVWFSKELKTKILNKMQWVHVNILFNTFLGAGGDRGKASCTIFDGFYYRDTSSNVPRGQVSNINKEHLHLQHYLESGGCVTYWRAQTLSKGGKCWKCWRIVTLWECLFIPVFSISFTEALNLLFNAKLPVLKLLITNSV